MKKDTFEKALELQYKPDAIDKEIAKHELNLGDRSEYGDIFLRIGNRQHGMDFDSRESTYTKQFPKDLLKLIQEEVDQCAFNILSKMKRERLKIQKEFDKLND